MRPPGAFMLFKEANKKRAWQEKQKGYSTQDFCRKLKKEYESLPPIQRAKFEELSDLSYKAYLEKYQLAEKLAEEIREKKEAIIKKGDYEYHTKRKKVSAYRVFKREIAE